MSETAVVNKVNDLKTNLFKNQFRQLQNFLGDEDKALKFLSAVAWCYESVPKLTDCSTTSVLGAFMKMAELGLYPSNTSGQAYVLPYWNGKKSLYEAQFQL